MSKPTRDQAEKAVKTLIEWAGDNPEREGLVETPKRVVKAYEQFFEGYDQAVSYTHLTLPTTMWV